MVASVVDRIVFSLCLSDSWGKEFGEKVACILERKNFQNVISPQWLENLVQSEGIRGLRSSVFGTSAELLCPEN